MAERRRPQLTVTNRRVPLPSGLTCVAIAATLIVGTVAGCGSSSSSSTSTSTSTPAITKTAFLAKGNAICTFDSTATRAAAAKLGNNPTRAQIVGFVKNTQVPSIQAQINSIRALGAPSADQATVTKMLNLAQADLNKVKSNPLLIASNHSPFADFATIAHPYGLTACAQNK